MEGVWLNLRRVDLWDVNWLAARSGLLQCCVDFRFGDCAFPHD